MKLLYNSENLLTETELDWKTILWHVKMTIHD